jgi:DNA-binding transcriptional regulator YbjK
MPAIMSSTAPRPSRRHTVVRASGKQRRLAIIQATLRVMAREGLRAVSHRAVAAEAGVPLASTTYYFRDLDDLITESFLHWSALQQVQVEGFYRRAVQILAASGREPDESASVARELARVAAEYVIEQVTRHRKDRVLELAFLHEAARVPRLRAVVREQQVGFLDFLEQFHTALGSQMPSLDAQITHSVLLGMEKSAVLADTDQPDAGSIRQVFERYLLTVLESGLRTC